MFIMASAPLNPQAPSTDHKYQALLAVSEAIVSHRDLSALFQELAGRLHQVVRFDYLVRNTPPADKSQPGLRLFAVPLPITSYRPPSMPRDEDGFLWFGAIHHAIHRCDPRKGSIETIDLPSGAKVASACICLGRILAPPVA